MCFTATSSGPEPGFVCCCLWVVAAHALFLGCFASIPVLLGPFYPPPHMHCLQRPRLCWAAGLWGCVCVLRAGGQTAGRSQTGSVDGDERPGVLGSTSGCHTGAQGRGAAPTPLSLQFRHSQHGAHRTTPPIPSPARHTQDGSSHPALRPLPSCPPL